MMVLLSIVTFPRRRTGCNFSSFQAQTIRQEKRMTELLTLEILATSTTQWSNNVRVIKTLSKQLELAARGHLLTIVNCAYVIVTVDYVKAAQGQNVKFYARNGATT